MKIRSLNILSFALSCIVPSTCDAFVCMNEQSAANVHSQSSTSLNVKSESRRLWLKQSFSVSTAALLLLQRPTVLPVFAETVDYSKIQDLLGPNGGDYVSQYQIPDQGKRPTWLTDPTDEFKESEQKAADFKRKNLMVSKEYQSLLDIVSTSPNNETTLIDALDSIRRLVKNNGGLPIGITKDMIIKTCRRRKAKKYWPTSVEVAYQDLVLEIGYQQSPNTDRDMSKL